MQNNELKQLSFAEFVDSTVKTNRDSKPAIKCTTEWTFSKRDQLQSTFGCWLGLCICFVQNNNRLNFPIEFKEPIQLSFEINIFKCKNTVELSHFNI